MKENFPKGRRNWLDWDDDRSCGTDEESEKQARLSRQHAFRETAEDVSQPQGRILFEQDCEADEPASQQKEDKGQQEEKPEQEPQAGQESEGEAQAQQKSEEEREEAPKTVPAPAEEQEQETDDVPIDEPQEAPSAATEQIKKHMGQSYSPEKPVYAPHRRQDNQLIDGQKVIVKSFDSPFAYLQWATHAPCMWKGELASRKSDDNEWSGTPTYEDAYHLAKYGWKEGLKMLTEQVRLAELMQPPTASQPVRKYDVAGYFPNPGRAAAGEMFNMVSPEAGELSKKPVIKISVNGTYPCTINPAHVMQWGAAICSYVNQLEKVGKSVQLDYVSDFIPSGDSSMPAVSLRFPLKKAGDPLSLASVVFWWAHPSSLRRIGFSALEKLDIEQGYQHGYGRYATVMKPEEGEFYLTIDDSGRNLEESLANIRRKHMPILNTLEAKAVKPAGPPLALR